MLLTSIATSLLSQSIDIIIHTCLSLFTCTSVTRSFSHRLSFQIAPKPARAVAVGLVAVAPPPFDRARAHDPLDLPCPSSIHLPKASPAIDIGPSSAIDLDSSDSIPNSSLTFTSHLSHRYSLDSPPYPLFRTTSTWTVPSPPVCAAAYACSCPSLLGPLLPPKIYHARLGNLLSPS